MRLALAIRAFFQILGNAAAAERVARALETATTGGATTVEESTSPAAAEQTTGEKAKASPSKHEGSRRSDALTLLAMLQREGRFIDFVKEPLSQYSDEQIGAAARDVHQSCAAVLDRFFDVQPMSTEEEGARIEVPVGFPAARWQLTGNVHGAPPFHGQLTHHGWEARKCELPTWTGKEKDATVLAPVEVEIT